jgi:hypothetical protein
MSHSILAPCDAKSNYKWHVEQHLCDTQMIKEKSVVSKRNNNPVTTNPKEDSACTGIQKQSHNVHGRLVGSEA